MRIDDVDGGLFGPSDGFIDGHLYCSLLGELAANLGARVLGWHKLPGRTRDDGSHVLRTDRAEFMCRYVVNAAGPWGDRVASCSDTRCRSSRSATRRWSVHLGRDLGYMMPSVMDYTPHSGESGLYFRHERPGQLIAGVHSEEATEPTVDPDSFARSADPDFLEAVARLLSGQAPLAGDAGLAHGWAGVYPVSPDGIPQVGPVHDAGTVIAAGGCGGSDPALAGDRGLVADWIIAGEPRAVSDGVGAACRDARRCSRPSATRAVELQD